MKRFLTGTLRVIRTILSLPLYLLAIIATGAALSVAVSAIGAIFLVVVGAITVILALAFPVLVLWIIAAAVDGARLERAKKGVEVLFE